MPTGGVYVRLEPAFDKFGDELGAVAVANALPAVQEKADFVTKSTHGPGVTELIEEMLRDDLASRELARRRHHFELGKQPPTWRAAPSIRPS